jgi:hypothetical protein
MLSRLYRSPDHHSANGFLVLSPAGDLFGEQVSGRTQNDRVEVLDSRYRINPVSSTGQGMGQASRE